MATPKHISRLYDLADRLSDELKTAELEAKEVRDSFTDGSSDYDDADEVYMAFAAARRAIDNM